MAGWALIAGPKHSHRNEIARRLAFALEDVGVRTCGVVQLRTGQVGERTTYDLQRIPDGERIRLAAQGTEPWTEGGEAFCSVVFWPEAFDVSRAWVEEDAPSSEVIFFGDVSKLESTGRGHDAAISWCLGLDPIKVVFLCVRSDQLYSIVEQYGLEEEVVTSLELPAPEAEVGVFIQETVAMLAERFAANRREDL